MIVPFFRDFGQRRKRDRTRDLQLFFTPFAKALSAVEAKQSERMESASRIDMLCMLVGLALLIASFAVGLYIGVIKGG
jgi:hypothetical protein